MRKRRAKEETEEDPNKEVRWERMEPSRIGEWGRKLRTETGKDKMMKLFISVRFRRRCKGKGKFASVHTMKACSEAQI